VTVGLSSSSDVETRSVGRRLAGLLRPGDVLLLCGPLGAGKTAFVGGLAEGLGVEEPVTSPSFVLMRRYTSGFIPLVHADIYRVGSFGEFDDLDVFEESRDAVLVVEWGNAVAAAMPNSHLRIEIEITGPTHRSLVLRPQGSWVDRPLEELAR
jgi:tRNA threonylcarbamoyladenosine biosynthesis protein TsaE